MKNILDLLKFHIGNLITYAKKSFKNIFIFDKVKHQLDRVEVVKEKVQQDVAQWKRDNAEVYEQDARMARKWFAQDLGKSKYGALYFAEYDGHFDEFVAGRTTSQFISLFKIELPKEDK